MTITKDEAKALLDECAIYLKEDETPRQRMDRDHADVLGLMDLLAKEKYRSANLAAEKAALEERVRVLEKAMTAVMVACDRGRMIPRPGCGVGGMTIEANIRGSVYVDVPAWPIEEARAALAEIKALKGDEE